ncbi:hypothetical protein ACFO9Q_10700 [Paenibacillus sp. GCM10023252]|uniref:hypothetical protein n=1 Tax=Paenibacillus sp. GCM10023252 TaxID=3252649 RepID=UPI0036066955
MARLRKLVVPIGLVLLAAAVWLVYQLVIVPTQSQPIVKADSWDEVKQYQYEMTPGLERAEKLKLTRNYDHVMQIPGTDDTLVLHEVWYSSELVYILYSVDAESSWSGGVKPLLSNVSFRIANEQADSSPGMYTLNWHPGEGIYYKGRLYGRLATNPLMDKDNKILSEVPSITIERLIIQQGNEQQSLKDVTFRLNYSAADERVETFPVDQSYEALDHTIRFDRLEMGPNHLKLYLDADSRLAGEKYYGATVSLRTNEGEVREGNMNTNIDDGEKYIQFQPLNKRPTEMSLEVKSLRYVNPAHLLKFAVEGQYQYNQVVKKSGENYNINTDKKLATVGQTDAYLEELYYDDRGVSFTIEYKTKKMKRPYIKLYADSPSIKLRGMEEQNEQTLQPPNLVQVINDKGEQAEYGQAGSGPGDRFSVFIDIESVKTSKSLDVTVSNLITELVTDWKTDIAIPPGD